MKRSNITSDAEYQKNLRLDVGVAVQREHFNKGFLQNYGGEFGHDIARCIEQDYWHQYDFVHQFITTGDIIVIHCGTHNMIADILTKPLTLQQFLYLRDYLLGYAIPQKGCVELSRAHGR